MTKNAERAEKFKKLGQWMKKQKESGPTLFNPHYAISGRAVQDRQLSSSTGPKMKTMQWEANGIRRG